MTRKSYSARTGMDARSSKILANAMFGAKPEFYEDDNGHVVRRWKPTEHSSYTNADLTLALSNPGGRRTGRIVRPLPAVLHQVLRDQGLPGPGRQQRPALFRHPPRRDRARTADPVQRRREPRPQDPVRAVPGRSQVEDLSRRDTWRVKTGSLFTKLPEGHTKIGISRGLPRNMPPGYRVYRKLAPGPWFNSVSVDEYGRCYKAEVLDRLDPHVVAAELRPGARWHPGAGLLRTSRPRSVVSSGDGRGLAGGGVGAAGSGNRFRAPPSGGPPFDAATTSPADLYGVGTQRLRRRELRPTEVPDRHQPVTVSAELFRREDRNARCIR